MTKKEAKGKVKLDSFEDLLDIIVNPKRYTLYMYLSNKLLSMSTEQLMRKSLNEIKANIEVGQIYFEKL